MNNDHSDNALPMERISLKTLQYVGLSAEKTTDVWEKWTHFDDIPSPFIREGDADTDNRKRPDALYRICHRAHDRDRSFT